MEKKIRVLVVDDSALMRKKLSDMINFDDACEVIATARNGEEAVRSVSALKPDVVTLDIELPKMDGMTALKYIMSEWPTPVVMVSAYSEYGGEATIKCLEYGAVDFVAKPGGVISLDIEKVRHELLTKLKAAAEVDLSILRPILIERRASRKKRTAVSSQKIVAIGSSTGGPRALAGIIPQFTPDILFGVVVIQHMPEGFTQSLADRLNQESHIRVKEAEDEEPIRQGEVLVAPGGLHLTVHREDRGEVVRLVEGPKEQGVIPSVDVTMRSIAPIYGKHAMGVVLTGMGQDGTEGLRAIKDFGGRTLACDRPTSIVYGMPKSAAEAKVVDKVVPLPEIASEIMKWARG